ncbi:MAG TPA: hypothetical protein VMU59_04105 [Caulobacteraceae bacterium]|nr:hypothetical protein [Caulobacteraceae bacterium]
MQTPNLAAPSARQATALVPIIAVSAIASVVVSIRTEKLEDA